jgi:hypothetical protein
MLNTDGRDHLTSPAALLTWARRTSLLDEAGAAELAATWKHLPGAGQRDLRTSIEIRESLYAAVMALLESRTPDFAPITARWAKAAPHAALCMTPAGRTTNSGPTSVRSRRSAHRSRPHQASRLSDRRRRLRLAVSRPQPQQQSALVRDGGLRHCGQVTQANRTSQVAAGRVSIGLGGLASNELRREVHIRGPRRARI